MAPPRQPPPSNSSTTPNKDHDSTSYSAMSTGDVEAIGAHCQMPFCRQLDFLPFRCESCKGKFCLDHRTESAHQCTHPGEWARRRAQLQQQQSSSSQQSSAPRPSVLSQEQQCAERTCKTLINTPLTTGVHCDRCRRSYCLKHRFQNEHDCSKLTPLGASNSSSGPTQRERGLAALEKLKAWGAAKKAAVPKLPESKSRQSAVARIQATATLKSTAKGEAKIPQEKRVYVHVEAAADSVTAKLPRGAFFYATDYSVGRVLDLAAKSLQVSNVNNRSDSEEDKLRVFHVEGGRLLEFGEKFGQAVQTGNTIVLLRGVGSGMVPAPQNTK